MNSGGPEIPNRPTREKSPGIRIWEKPLPDDEFWQNYERQRSRSQRRGLKEFGETLRKAVERVRKTVTGK